MSRSVLPFLFFALVLAGEWYGFQAVRTMVQHATPGARRATLAVYWLLTVVIWGLGIWALSNRRAHASFKSYFGGLLLAMLAAKIVVVIPMLLEDVVRVGRWALQAVARPAAGSGPAISRSEFISKLALVAGAVPFVSLIWGMVRGSTDYTVKRVTLRFPNLPASFDGFKVLQISDLHTGSFQSKEPLQRAVAMINKQQADLIFMTGDLVNNFAHEVEEHIETLAGIQSRLPIYSVLGNHDYADYVNWAEQPGGTAAKAANLERLKQNHAKIGWRLLLDEAHHVERNGERIAVIGVENWGANMNFPKYGNLAKAHAASDAPFKILLSHDPSHWEAQVHGYEDIDLTLSGHTHGMQFGVNLPFLKWSPVQYAYKQWAGLYQRGRQYLYVNAGLGFIGYPGRVGFLPEITVFELRRA